MSAKTQRDHRKPNSHRGGTQRGGTDLLPHSGDGSAARLRTVTYTCVYFGIGARGGSAASLLGRDLVRAWPLVSEGV